MIDLASYHELQHQYETLKSELEKFSPLLAERNYAIALTRSDAMSQEEAIEKSNAFLKLLDLKPVAKSRFGFNEEYPAYEQENFDLGFRDTSLPFFVAPISSATSLNIKPLTYALYHMVLIER
jgi:GTP-binding protein